jgi:transposase
MDSKEMRKLSMIRKQWGAQEKLRIALLAYKSDQTIEEICRQYKVAASQVHAWKKRLMTEGAILFGKVKGSDEESDRHKELTALYEKIGELIMERDFLKKVWGNVQGRKG